MKATILAQKINIGGSTIEGPLKINLPGQGTITDPKLGDIVTLIFAFVLPLAGILLFFYLVAGGYSIMTSRGEAEAVAKGKKRISAAIVGFFLLALSFLAVRLIARIFGIGGGLF